MVLLVVDTQILITNDKLYMFDRFEENVKKFIKVARENCIEVIFIRHDDGEGKALTKGTEGFEIYSGFKPLSGEKIFDKTANSAFYQTGLLEYLKSLESKEIMIVGLQTDYCIDATVKCGFEHNFKMIVPEYCNSTFDNDFMSAEKSYKYYNEFIWKDRYADCVSIETALEMMKVRTK
ncbi:MAG: cysteine hydrolase [Oscillospiraceae bacterium]|nr:cysteine hydrolase [Oscillospiraceae bacterium]